MDDGGSQSVTDRLRQLEDALRSSEERLRSVLAAMAEGVIVYDRDGRVVDFNDSVLRILGCTREQMVGTKPPDPSWRPINEDGTTFDLARKPSRLALQSGEPQFGIIQGIERPGRTTWISITAIPLLTPGTTRPAGAVATMTDITESRAALLELRRSEERYRSVIAALSEGLIVLDSSFRIVACNDSATRMFGLVASDVLGKNASIASTVTSEDGTELALGDRPGVRTVLTGEAEHDMVLRVVTGRGEARWLSVNAQPLSLPGDAGGRGAVITFSDITAKKQAEAERQGLEEQLRQSQKMEAVGTLASGIAHDFNNLLAAILGNLDLALMDMADDHPARIRLSEIERASERGRELVQRLTTFGRRGEVRLRPVRVARVIDEALRLLRPVLPASVAFTHEIRDDVAVMADETQLHQVLVNLCTNASGALGDEPGTIRIELARAGAGKVRLSVIDDGAGMDEATKARIFDPFFTTKAVGTGTGLGLAVVHGIVTGLGGTISVDSAPGRGARFDIVLPEAAPEHPAHPGGDRVAGASDAAHGGLILFIDDDPALVTLGRAALERGGFQVAGFEDPAKALEAFRANPQSACLVITDVVMPGMSGMDLAAEIRRLRADVPLVLTSALDSLVPEDALKRLAPARLALKPWSHVGLVELARETLG